MALSDNKNFEGTARTVGHGLRVIVATRIFTPEVAAAAFRLNSLAEMLASQGANVRVLTTKAPKNSRQDSTADSVSVSRFPVFRDRSGNIRGYLQYLSFDIPLLFRLLFSKADVTIAEPPPTTGAVVAMVSALHHRPFVYYAADIWTDAVAATNAPKIVVRLMRIVESFVLRHASAVLAVSEDVAHHVRELGATRVHTVGNGVDTSVFSVRPSSRDTAEPAVDTDEFFVYAGTMSEWQGAEVFLEAFALQMNVSPQLQLHIFGQGSDLTTMKARAAEISQHQIQFHGLVPAAVIAGWLRKATAALVSITPNQGYDFAKPTKLFAAAACGTPVIFAGVGAAKTLVDTEGLGVAVPHSAEAVAKAMQQMLEEQHSGVSSSRRAARAQWAQDFASLNAVGERAAHIVLSVIAEPTKDSHT